MKETEEHISSKNDEKNEVKEEKTAMVIRIKGLQNQIYDYEQSLELLHEGVVIANHNPEGKIIISYLNKAARDLLRHDIKEEFTSKGLPLEQWSDLFKLHEKDGTPIPMENLPLMIAIKTEVPTPSREIIRKDSEVKYLRTKATPLRNANGKVQAAIMEIKKHYPWIKAHPGIFFRLVVSDQGDGMPPEVAGKLYNEQITTKEKGTGEGSLSIRTALTYSGGFPKVESNHGKGTKIEMYFPIVEKPPEQLELNWEKKEG